MDYTNMLTRGLFHEWRNLWSYSRTISKADFSSDGYNNILHYVMCPHMFNVMYTCQKMDVQWVNGLQMKEFCFLHLTIIFYLICTCFRSFMCAIIIKWANSDKGLNHKWVIFLTFWLFHKKEFLKGFFCNLFLKIVTIPLINYITCVNFFWINMKVLKV